VTWKAVIVMTAVIFLSLIFHCMHRNSRMCNLVLAFLFVKVPVPQTGNSKGIFFGFRVKLPLINTSPTTQRWRQSR